MHKHEKKTINTILQIPKRLFISLRRKTKRQGGQVSSPAGKEKTSSPPQKKQSISRLKWLSVIAGTAAVIAIIAAVVTAHAGNQIIQSEDPIIAADNTVEQVSEIEPAATPLAEPKVTLAMPASAPFSISEGMDAAIVEDIQIRLIALGYMEADEPGTVYSETTKTAVEHFQDQSGLDVTGTVDQQTYDLLMSDQAQYYTMSIGAEGTDVSELTQRLYELDYMDTVTGEFDTETEAAVKKFQKVNGLTADGKVNKDTREMLYADNAVPNMYAYGEQSPEILIYQQRLKELGYLTTKPDGSFGEDTKAAVRRFQEHNGLVVDGYIGPTTKAALMSDESQPNTLAVGAKGEDVSNVQKRLQALGYMGNVTGYYDQETEAAVRSFQQINGLTVDGQIGSRTMNTLLSGNAIAHPVEIVSRGSSDTGASAPDSSTPDPSTPDPSTPDPSTPDPSTPDPSTPDPSTPDPATPDPSTPDPSPSSDVTGANVESLIAVAESKLGCKYVWSAKGPDTFDCSGFVYWCLNQVGVNQGYMTSAMWAGSDYTSKYTRIGKFNDMQRGDIIVYNGHMGIYAGNGVMIDASSSNGKVVKRDCTSSWFTSNFICAFRVF